MGPINQLTTMATFDNIMNCSVGGTAFQLMSYSKSERAVYDVDGNRIGADVEFSLTGELQAADLAGLASALAALETSCRTDGASLTITGLNNANLDGLAASSCIDGGPHYTYKFDNEQGHNYQSVSVAAVGRIAADDESGVLSHTYTASTSYAPDGLKTIATRGHVITLPGESAETKAIEFTPDAPDGSWARTAMEHSTANTADTEADYSVTYAQLVTEYPDPNILDGEWTVTSDYDAHNRKVLRYEYQYSGSGAESYLNTIHAQLRSAGGLVRASIRLAKHKSRTVAATFEILTPRVGGDYLLELQEQIRAARGAPRLAAKTYAGTVPLVYQLPDGPFAYVQAGRAIGLAKFPEPPAYKFDEIFLADEAMNTNRLNDVEYETTWEFTYLFPSKAAAVVLPSTRADSKGFYG
jgi:hypothetical protein